MGRVRIRLMPDGFVEIGGALYVTKGDMVRTCSKLQAQIKSKNKTIESLVAATDVVQSLLSDMRRTAQQGLPQEMNNPEEEASHEE